MRDARQRRADEARRPSTSTSTGSNGRSTRGRSKRVPSAISARPVGDVHSATACAGASRGRPRRRRLRSQSTSPCLGILRSPSRAPGPVQIAALCRWIEAPTSPADRATAGPRPPWVRQPTRTSLPSTPSTQRDACASTEALRVGVRRALPVASRSTARARHVELAPRTSPERTRAESATCSMRAI
jgi:hypothetical protein